MIKKMVVLIAVSLLGACSEQQLFVRSESSEPAVSGAIQDIRLVHTPEGIEVQVEGTRPMVYATFRLTNPDRLVIDIAQTDLGRFRAPIRPGPGETGLVQSVTPITPENMSPVPNGLGTKKGGVARLEIALANHAKANVRTEGTRMVVEVTQSLPPLTSSAVEATPNVAPVASQVSYPAATVVTGIAMIQKPRLELVVTADGKIAFKDFTLSKNRLVIDLLNVRLAKPIESIYPGEGAKPVVRQVRVGKHPDKVRLVVDLEKRIFHHVESEANRLHVYLGTVGTETAKPSPVPVVPTPVVAKEAPMPAKPVAEILSAPKTVPVQTKTVAHGPELPKTLPAAAHEPELPKTLPVVASEREPPKPAGTEEPKVSPEEAQAYVGKKISLDFQNADIAHVVRLIADVSGLNIVLGDNVKGEVTMSLMDVPWDQALDTLLQINNLGQTRKGNIILIATLEDIVRQKDQEARAKENESRAEDLATRVITVNYSTAKDLAPSIKKLLSPRGDLTVDDRTNTIIVKDIQRHLDQADELVKTLDLQTPQVMIEARIVQMSPTFNRSLGIQWGVQYNDILDAARIGLGNASSGSAFGTPTPTFAVNLPASSSVAGLGFTFGRFTDNPFNLDLRLSAGESQGLTRIVSTPKISVLDNQEARIQQGESIPYATTSITGGTQTTFIDASLTLVVTPHISRDGNVLMKITVTKNAPGEVRVEASGPSILKKEATTIIQVKDGETAVIGGIYEVSKSDSSGGVPYLMDVPILGRLFRTDTKREDVSELVVFLTPKIVKTGQTPATPLL